MSAGIKISSQKLFRIITGAALAVVFFVALVAASLHQQAQHIAGITVKIVNDNEHNFIQKKDVENLLSANNKINLSHHTIGNIDLNLIEKTIRTNPWVERADAYIDNEQKLNIDITQRVPTARIFFTNGSSAYLDNALILLPLSNSYAYAAPVFTNVPYLGKDSLSNHIKSQIAYLSAVIAKDTFWNAQITQIVLEPNMDFTFIPLLGNQKIVFGDTAFAEDKLKNLFGFYQHVSSKIGWDKYEVLDVRFKGQIVASPAIGYIPPKVTDSVNDDFSHPPAINNQLSNAVATHTDSITKTVVQKPVAAAKPKPDKLVQKDVAKSNVAKVPAKAIIKKAENKSVAIKPGDKKTNKNQPKHNNKGTSNNHN